MPPAILIVVLICSGATPVESCNRDTALDVIIPGPAPTPFACLMAGQAAIARDPAEVADRRYALTRCEPRRG